MPNIVYTKKGTVKYQHFAKVNRDTIYWSCTQPHGCVELASTIWTGIEEYLECDSILGIEGVGGMY